MSRYITLTYADTKAPCVIDADTVDIIEYAGSAVDNRIRITTTTGRDVIVDGPLNKIREKVKRNGKN